MSSSLSIVIPAYNESARIGKTLREVLAYLDAQPGGGEVIVVDDGSRDETSRVAEQVFAVHERGRAEGRVIRVESNRGKGNAVRTGLLAARARVAAFFDADLSMPITETPKLVEPIRSGQYDIVLGSRALDRKLIGTHQPWTREQSGRVFNRAMRMLTGLPFRDTQCGFKAFRMDVCRPVVEGALIDRFGFDVELLFIAQRAGLRMLEYPVRWDDVAGGSVSFRGGLQGFGELRRIRQNSRRGLYDSAIQRAREAAVRVKDRRALTEDGDEIESDVSPELAGQRI
ncbi:MAG TPA: dolichyl-phosphate beta-glucosyltransferase [Pyrinomonadaceae bacterium]|jgi:glycosyltransferase involved in cell wall biosynthesis|nr:dolichyl-phosphate beta-glucosyltransferase [Pyrinomonadaceae bacterium]